MLLGAVVHGAHRSDHKGLTLMATWSAPLWQCLQLIWTDSTFGGRNFIAWIEQTFGWTLEVVRKKRDKKGLRFCLDVGLLNAPLLGLVVIVV